MTLLYSNVTFRLPYALTAGTTFVLKAKVNDRPATPAPASTS